MESLKKETDKENQFLPSLSLKRNCTNRHSLHQKLEHKQSLDNFKSINKATLSNSVSSIPIFDYHDSSFYTTYSSDGTLTTSRKTKDLNNLIKTDNRLSPKTRPNFLIANGQSLNDQQQHPTKTLSISKYDSNQISSAKLTNGTATKRRSSMLDSSPTKLAISQIQEFVETSIVLKKDRNNELGISIIGGNDTYLESICVCEVHEGGAASADGRIRKGDIILACNEYSFRTVNYADAIRVLKEAPSPLKLLILRENPQKLFTTSQSPTKFITVELKKQSIKDKLGISFLQRTNGVGVFVTYVVPNSIAAIMGKGKILQGDQLLEINGQNVRESNQKDVANQLNQLDGEIVLLLGRVPSLTSCIQDWCRKRMQIHWRTRTSTWSAYGGSKDKIQNQRPSLPVGKETPLFNTHSPEMESRPQSPFSSNRPSISTAQLPIIQANKIDPSLINTNTATAAIVGSHHNLAYCKGQLFQQVSQQLAAFQEQQQKLQQEQLNISKQINTYPDQYRQNCVNTPEDAISLVGFSRSSSVRSRNRLGVLIEDPSFNNKQIKNDLDIKESNNFLTKSPSLFSANISHLFTDLDEQYYNGPQIEPLDDETTCYLAEKLDAEDKFVPFEDRDQKDQQELIDQQLKQQRLAFKEERQAAQHDKHKSKHKQIITSIQDNSQANRHHKRSFLLRRSNSSKAATTKPKKTHIPQIQVTEF